MMKNIWSEKSLPWFDSPHQAFWRVCYWVRSGISRTSAATCQGSNLHNMSKLQFAPWIFAMCLGEKVLLLNATLAVSASAAHLVSPSRSGRSTQLPWKSVELQGHFSDQNWLLMVLHIRLLISQPLDLLFPMSIIKSSKTILSETVKSGVGASSWCSSTLWSPLHGFPSHL